MNPVSGQLTGELPTPPVGNGVAEALRDKLPVPSEVLEQALREFNEVEVAAGIREIQGGGGLSLADFYPDLEKLCNPPE